MVDSRSLVLRIRVEELELGVRTRIRTGYKNENARSLPSKVNMETNHDVKTDVHKIISKVPSHNQNNHSTIDQAI